MRCRAIGVVVAAVVMWVGNLWAGAVWLEWAGKTDITEGSARNPVRVGSAHDFDSYLNGLPPQTVIHLAAGTFETETYFNVKSGWKICGEGIDRTIVQVTNMGVNPQEGVWWQHGVFAVFCSGINKAIRGAEISDLTVDCNLQNQTAASGGEGLDMEAVALRGDDLRVERMKVINFGSTFKAENFVIALSYQSKQWWITNLTIDACEITQPAKNAPFPGGVTCLLVGGLPVELAGNNHELDPHAAMEPGPGWSFGAEVKNCKVYGFSIAGNAIGICYQSQCRVHDNRVINCPGLTCVYGENIAFDGLEVANNYFSNVGRGLLLGDYGFENLRLRRNLTIRGNTVDNASSLGISIVGSISPKANGYLNVNVIDNVVSGGAGHPAIRVEDATNVVVANNILHAPDNKFQLWLGRDGNVLETNNQNFDGSKPVVSRQ